MEIVWRVPLRPAKKSALHSGITGGVHFSGRCWRTAVCDGPAENSGRYIVLVCLRACPRILDFGKRPGSKAKNGAPSAR